MGNLIIEDGGLLQLNDSVTLVMNKETTWPTPIYGISIDPGAKFVIDSPLRTTTIQTPSTPIERYRTYPFLNSGTVDFL
jgi:hypothetical protein